MKPQTDWEKVARELYSTHPHYIKSSFDYLISRNTTPPKYDGLTWQEAWKWCIDNPGKHVLPDSSSCCPRRVGCDGVLLSLVAPGRWSANATFPAQTTYSIPPEFRESAEPPKAEPFTSEQRAELKAIIREQIEAANLKAGEL